MEGSGRVAAGLRGDAVGVAGVVGIAVAAISPTTSVFLVYGTGLVTAGTGVVWAFVVGAVIALAMALCYAETGSIFPSAGGACVIVRRALGPVAGGVANVLFMVLGLVSTASILVAAATYLSSLVPGGLPVNAVALAMMVLVTALSTGRLSPAGWVAGVILALESAVILVFTAAAFTHWSGHTHPFAAPRAATTAGALPHGVGTAALLAAVVPALFAFNGYDWPLYFTEESRGDRRSAPRAVMLAAVLAVVLELLAVTAATGAIRDLGATAADGSPLTVIARQALGGTGTKILIAGVVVAMFDTGLAANLGYARVYYAAARDGMLPGPAARLFGHISPRTGVPVRGFLFLLAGNGVLCLFSSLNGLITFTGVMIVLVYLLVALSALVCRVRDRDAVRPFRMRLWPLPPLVAIAGAVVVLTRQHARDLAVAFGVAGLALIAHALVRRRLPARDRDAAGPDTASDRRTDPAPR